MDMFTDLFNATLAYNPFKAMFCESKFTGSEITSMLQSGLFMSFITLCHYWEVWNIIHFSFISLTYIHMLLLILQGPFPNIAPYHLFLFQPLCLLWGIYYMVSGLCCQPVDYYHFHVMPFYFSRKRRRIKNAVGRMCVAGQIEVQQ